MGMVSATRENWQRRVKPRIEEVKQWVRESPAARYRPVLLVGRVFRQWGQDDATLLAAGIAYFFLFSLFPLMLGLLAIAGLAFNSPEVQRNFLLFVSENLPGATGFVERNVRDVVRLQGVLGLGAIIGMLWTASAVFGAISKAVNRAWGAPNRPFYIAKPRHLAMALVVLVLFLVSTTLTGLIYPLAQGDLAFLDRELFLPLILAEGLLRTLSWLLSFGIFLLIYRFVPNCQTHWRSVWLGAVIAAILFEAGKSGFAWYLGTLANFDQVYGSLASVIVLLLWAYISAMILLLGAEVSSEYEKLYYGRERPAAGDLES